MRPHYNGQQLQPLKATREKSFADEEDENVGDDDAYDDHDGNSNVVNDVDHNHEDKYDEN